MAPLHLRDNPGFSRQATCILLPVSEASWRPTLRGAISCLRRSPEASALRDRHPTFPYVQFRRRENRRNVNPDDLDSDATRGFATDPLNSSPVSWTPT